jgi:hypothetical protein
MMMMMNVKQNDTTGRKGKEKERHLKKKYTDPRNEPWRVSCEESECIKANALEDK